MQEEQLTRTQQQLESSEREKQTVIQSKNQVRDSVSVIEPVINFVLNVCDRRLQSSNNNWNPVRERNRQSNNSYSPGIG